MKIMVNREPIDFELDGGESLQEIISSLNEWAAKGGSVIADLKLDDKPISLDDAATSSLKVEEIQTLEVGLQGIEEMVLAGLDEAGNYLPRLIAGVDQIIDLAEIKEFVDGLGWLNEIISKTENLLNLDYNNIYLDEERVEEKRTELTEVTDLLKEKIEEGSAGEATIILRERVKSLLEDWLRILPKLIEEVPQMADSRTLLNRLHDTSKEIPAISKRIEEVSIDLQTGDGAKAMEQFQEIIDDLKAMVHLLQDVRISFDLDYQAIQAKDQTIEERTQELNELLSEIITAFENEDIVMLADLLEYELSPLLSRWEEVIVAITTQVERKIN